MQDSGLDIDARAYDNMKEMISILREDHRQGLLSVTMTDSFEEAVVRSQKEMCFPEKNRDNAIIENLRPMAEDAVYQQLNFYYILSDFILPGMESMKAIALMSARQIAGQSVPKRMAEQASQLATILKRRAEYNINKTQTPFTLSLMKVFSSRDIKNSGPFHDLVEELRWEEVLLRSIHMSFLGRNKDAQELVACGVYRKEAPELLKKEETKMRENAEAI